MNEAPRCWYVVLGVAHTEGIKGYTMWQTWLTTPEDAESWARGQWDSSRMFKGALFTVYEVTLDETGVVERYEDFCIGHTHMVEYLPELNPAQRTW